MSLFLLSKMLLVIFYSEVRSVLALSLVNVNNSLAVIVSDVSLGIDSLELEEDLVAVLGVVRSVFFKIMELISELGIVMQKILLK